MITINDTTPGAYETIVEMLRAEDVTSSRAGDTREILNVSVVSENPRERYLWRDVKWNLAFQLQEHFAYWNGLNPGHVERYVDMSKWLDDDGKLPGSAYGDRLRNTAEHDQIARVISQLRDNPETRRAVMQIHQAAIEDYDGPDVSCTESLQLFMRNGKLHMTAVVRSQDMYWGYAYDAANNQFIQEIIAGMLSLSLGTYTHVMKSCHYYTEYEDDIEASLDTYRVESTPDMRRSNAGITLTMSRLDEGLQAARNGYTPDVLMYLNEPYASWLRVMLSYEFSEFRDYSSSSLLHHDPIQVEWWKDWVASRIQ